VTFVDTCFLIDLMKGNADAEHIALNNKDLKTTAISSAEFLYGAKKSGKKKLYEVSEKFLNYFPIVPFDAESAAVYADIASTLSGNGRHISTLDELIAAVVIRYGESLVTRDRHFGGIEGLELIPY
jgi:tRNA(fMet)-specific endonuclease VapC